MIAKSDNQLPNSAPPQPPEKPLPTDCCDSGCEPCVMDSYLDDLAAYEQALSNWQLAKHELDETNGQP